jgi:hypothetical protein
MQLTIIYPGEHQMWFSTKSEKTQEALDEVYKTLQIVDGHELPVKLGIRPMMVGDLIHKKSEDRWFLCDLINWKEISEEKAKKWKFLPRRDRVMGYDCLKEEGLI